MISKVDGLYNVLFALSTFIVGVIISQRNFLLGNAYGNLSFSLVGDALSRIASYAIGFHGMIKDPMVYRILSWSLLLSLLPYFTMNFIMSYFAQLYWESSAIISNIVNLVPAVIIQVFVDRVFAELVAMRFRSLGIETRLEQSRKGFFSRAFAHEETSKVVYISLIIFSFAAFISTLLKV